MDRSKSILVASATIVCLAGITAVAISERNGQRAAGEIYSQSRQSVRFRPEKLDSIGFNFDTPAMMCKADVVVDVTVQKFMPAVWNTADGNAPQLAGWPQALQVGYGIYTPVSFDRLTVLRSGPGVNSPAKLPFYLYGGAVAGDSLETDAPGLQPGAEYVLIGLPRYDVQLHAYSHAAMVIHQAFPVDSQSNVVLKPRIVEQGTVSQEQVTEPLARLKAALTSC